ncbi:TPA: 7-carboxy-7-deazaguanine synthase QueE [Candidatus Poribacteria bacterium]|nr:7-carboxy-7-deazaguanine synthase QueE [Candidatus Poribacteria bacterium]
MVRVIEIFYSIQGEGHRTGQPMVFVRLAGCNLRCDFCDTKYAWKMERGKRMSEEEILEEVSKYGCDWVCLTGGEPTLQDLSKLIPMLREEGYKVAVETNGTIFQKSLRLASWVTVSPKEGADVHPLVMEITDELKYVIRSEGDLKRIRYHPLIYLQPVDNDPDAVRICVEAVLKNPRWRLSVQVHKLIGIP